jgi:type II secretory pathway pseudopilin PulG
MSYNYSNAPQQQMAYQQGDYGQNYAQQGSYNYGQQQQNAYPVNVQQQPYGYGQMQQQAASPYYHAQQRLIGEPMAPPPSALLLLRAADSAPKAVIEIEGRESDMRAAIVMTISVSEDRAVARALIDYTVRFAPASVFRFALPGRTGGDVKIDAPNLRETTLKSSPEADEWTIVAQEAVLGNYRATLEWPLKATPSEEPVEAPELVALGVTSQRGFIIVEGSETLRLRMETRNLAELDLYEAPPTPWEREHRALAAYRYVAPPFSLKIIAEEFEPATPPDGFVREASLATAFNAAGGRVTRAEYRFAPARDRQFMEISLPEGAQLWAALVNGRGEKPARRLQADNSPLLLLPLPAAGVGSRDAAISLLYFENAPAMETLREIKLQGPELPVPVHKTSWELQLPPEFSYLAFDGAMADQKTTVKPALTWLREARYPRLALFRRMTGDQIAFACAAALVLGAIYIVLRAKAVPAPEADETGSVAVQQTPGLRVFEFFLTAALLFAVAGMAWPNFRDAQTRAKIERVEKDMGALMGALQAYRSDKGSYPARLAELTQGAVKYLDAIPRDPFAPSPETTPLSYLVGPEAAQRGRAAGLYVHSETDFWLAYSVGPDGEDDGGASLYNPASGSQGRGDVVWSNYGASRSYKVEARPWMSQATWKRWMGRLWSGVVATTLIGIVYFLGKNAKKLLEMQPPQEKPSAESESAGWGWIIFIVIVISFILFALYTSSIWKEQRLSHSLYTGSATQKMVGSITHDAQLEDYGADGRVQAEKARENLMTHNGNEGYAYGDATESLKEARNVHKATQYLKANGDREKKSLEAPAAPQPVLARPLQDENKPWDMAAAEPEPQAAGVAPRRPGARPPSESSPDTPSQGPASQSRGGRASQDTGLELEEAFSIDESQLRAAGILGGQAAAKARVAGLLSLELALPEGAIRRRFETLGGEANVTVQLIDRDARVRLERIAWASAFLLFSALALGSMRLYRTLFVCGSAAALLWPILLPGPWTFLLNGALLGIFLSLATPAAFALARRWSASFRAARRPPNGLSAPALVWVLAALLMASGSPSAWAAPVAERPLQQEARAKQIAPSDGPIYAATVDKTPIRLLAPYDALEEAIAGKVAEAFISREDFIRLWRAAHDREREPKNHRMAFLAEANLEATLSPETETVWGTLTLSAANPSDYAETVPAALGELSLEEPVSDPPGAAIESGPRGLSLRLPPHWSGTLEARFSAPARIDGLEGGWNPTLPEAGAGLWRLEVPYPNAAVPESARVRVTERGDNKTVFLGAMRGGPLRLTWSGKPASRAASGDDDADAGPFSAKVNNFFLWETLSQGDWSATVELEAAGGAAELPREIVFPVDPGLRVVDAQSESLVGADIETNRLTLRLAETDAATIKFRGFLPPPAQESDLWTAAALRAPLGSTVSGEVSVEIANRIEIGNIIPKGLRDLSAASAQPGRAARRFRMADPQGWSLQLELSRRRDEFRARVDEVVAPERGVVRRAASAELTALGRPLREVSLRLPKEERVSAVEGGSVSGWTRLEDRLLVSFSPPVERVAGFVVHSRADTPGGLENLMFHPLEIIGATQTDRTVAILIPVDRQLAKGDLERAEDSSPNATHQALSQSFGNAGERPEGILSAHKLSSAEPVRYGLEPIQASAFVRAYNLAVVGEGRKTLETSLVLEPQTGRLEKVEARLILPEPDPGAASRLQALGPLRDTRVEAVSDREWRVVVEFDAPKSSPTTIRFQLEQPAETSGDADVRPAIILPAAETGGTTAWLIVRRAFEGELVPRTPGDAQAVDRSRVTDWPSDAMFQARPSDLVYEVPIAATVPPSFGIERHKRDDALRAIVDALRERAVVTPDGFERRELTIQAQNQSEQFLRIALPHPRSEVTIQEALVGGQPSKWSFATENNREVLLVPLIRTGLLEPELTIRIAYSALGDGRFGKSGNDRRFELPEILGGVPVSQSSLILVLPREYKYSDFEGSLNKVELVDIQADEAKRLAKNAEKLSEVALQAEGHLQVLALEKLSVLNERVEQEVKSSRASVSAYDREVRRKGGGKAGSLEGDKKLAQKRDASLREAEQAQMNLYSNLSKLESQTAQQLQPQREELIPQQILIAPPPPDPGLTRPSALEFPGEGEVFAFRQLQGAGHITFDYIARDTRGARFDLVLGAGLIGGLAALAFAGSWIAASRRRVGVTLLFGCLIALGFQVLMDLAMPGLVVAMFLIFFQPQEGPAAGRA